VHGLNVKFVAKEGKREEILHLLDSMLSQVKEEPETLVYLVHTADEDPNAIWFWMVYASEAAMQVHGDTEIDRELRQKFQPMLESTEVIRLTLVGGKSLPV
jgi:quinol monooxygenase YgiN